MVFLFPFWELKLLFLFLLCTARSESWTLRALLILPYPGLSAGWCHPQSPTSLCTLIKLSSGAFWEMLKIHTWKKRGRKKRRRLCKVEKNEKEFKRKRICDLIILWVWAISPTNCTRSSLVLYLIYRELFLPSRSVIPGRQRYVAHASLGLTRLAALHTLGNEGSCSLRKEHFRFPPLLKW